MCSDFGDGLMGSEDGAMQGEEDEVALEDDGECSCSSVFFSVRRNIVSFFVIQSSVLCGN